MLGLFGVGPLEILILLGVGLLLLAGVVGAVLLALTLNPKDKPPEE